MFLRLLCIALVACTLAQGAPQLPFGGSELADVMSGFGDAIRETVQDNVKNFRDTAESAANAGMSSLGAGGSAVRTGANIFMTLPRIGAKLFENIVPNGQSQQQTEAPAN